MECLPFGGLLRPFDIEKTEDFWFRSHLAQKPRLEVPSRSPRKLGSKPLRGRDNLSEKIELEVSSRLRQLKKTWLEANWLAQQLEIHDYSSNICNT